MNTNTEKLIITMLLFIYSSYLSEIEPMDIFKNIDWCDFILLFAMKAEMGCYPINTKLALLQGNSGESQKHLIDGIFSRFRLHSVTAPR